MECPYAKSDMTPCAYNDGDCATLDNGNCVGCNATSEQVNNLSKPAIEVIYAQKCAEPSDINEHLPTLKRYTGECQYVTEFGVRSIVSTWALIAGIPGQVTSYDLNSPGEKAIHEVEVIAESAGVFFVFYRVDVRGTDINPTDLLFIDTYHTYLQLKTELDRHADKVRKWIILHDTEIFGEKGEDGGPGLNQAVKEFVDAGSWKIKEVFTNNNGLTVLERR